MERDAKCTKVALQGSCDVRNATHRLPSADTDTKFPVGNICLRKHEMHISRFAPAEVDSLEGAQISDGVAFGVSALDIKLNDLVAFDLRLVAYADGDAGPAGLPTCFERGVLKLRIAESEAETVQRFAG